MSKIASFQWLAILEGCHEFPDLNVAILQGCQHTLSGNLAKASKCTQKYEWQSCIHASDRAKAAQRRKITTYSNQGCKVANFKSKERWQPWKVANLKKLAILSQPANRQTGAQGCDLNFRKTWQPSKIATLQQLAILIHRWNLQERSR